MILGTGLDVVSIIRMKKWRERPGIFERYFHEIELKTAKQRGNMEIHSLAARFAAKEAFGKALGNGLNGICLKEIAVVNNRHGKPDIILYGKALAALKRIKGKKVFVSLTHEHDYALANVIIEG